MKALNTGFLCLIGLLAGSSFPAYATVQILSMTPSPASPQLLGTPVTWTVSATDSNPGPLTFQFNVASPSSSLTLARDFNLGALSSGIWKSQPFTWVPTAVEGVYQIQVVIKDFTSGETASRTIKYQVNPLVLGKNPIVVPTANPLVALFSAPACPAGSSMRVYFQESQATPATTTNWVNCRPSATMSFEIAGMYPNTTYYMKSQTLTSGKITAGPTRTFTTGALPATITFPNFKVLVPGTDTTAPLILHNLVQLGGGIHYPDVATDLSGSIMWYYNTGGSTDLLTRPLPNGGMLTIQAGAAWNPASSQGQLLRQIDLAGNIVRETNTGSIQQQLVALGVSTAGPCDTIPSPAPVGSGCLGAFHHDAIRFSTPSGTYTAVIGDLEKIFAPGTQGDTSGLPVDIIGDIIVVLDSNWKVVWYFDTFQHAKGGTQLDINRPAVLGETCVSGQTGCPPVFLLGPDIAPKAHDWLHANSLYYWPTDGSIIWSSRHQDWIMKVDFRNGSGNGNILWRMGLDGDFAFRNIYNDPWPWFSHQHDAGIETSGTGVMTIFDNGNTRVSAPPLGLGSNCGPSDCNNRGMSLTVDQTNLEVTPDLSVDLGVYGPAMGSAQLLDNGKYYFLPPNVLVTVNSVAGYSIEIAPTPGTATGTQILNLRGPEHYRGWQMPNLYTVPTT
jgi:arylsulfate sulfotransferase